MSGDVQPRKRKDKRRKKADGDYHIQRIRGASFDDDDAGTPPPTLINPSSEHSTDNVTIHVHKEGGTGGHWCARIIFFALLSVLVGLVGLIIFEHRGVTDVDTPVAASRWAVIFDGWVDDIIPQHDDEPHEDENNASDNNDEHGDEETEEEEEEEDEHEDHEDEDEEEEEEEEEEETEENEKSENMADKDSTEVDEGIGSDEEAADEGEEEGEERDESENDEDDEDEQTSVEEEIVRQHVYRKSREISSDRGDDDSRDKTFDEGFGEGDSIEDNEDTLEELDENSEEDTNDVKNGDEEENGDEESNDEEEEEKEEANNLLENDLDISIEGVKASTERDEDDISQEYFSIPGVGEIDDNSAEPLEEIEDGDLEEVANELEIEPDEDEEIEEESASVAVKFGVGVALIVAAHFVLVRRWNNVDADLAGSYSDEVLDLSRRNTIVPPLNPKDIITTNEPDEQATIHDEKVVKSYEELRNKYKSLEVDSPVSSKKILGMENLQLRNTSMQEKSTPEDKRTVIKTDTREKEEEVEDMQTSESERLSATEPEEDEEEEISEEEESEELEEEEDEEEEDVEVPDDSELVAKLEAKYGKLPTPTESEDEEDYDDEDEDEEEEEDEEAEEEDEEIQGWKRVRAPKATHTGGSEVEQHRETRGKEPVAKGSSGSSKSGPKSVHENVNDSSIDEVSIQEEMNSWLSKEFDN